MKRIVSVLLLLGLVACAREYELVDSSEYYFYPEEYEERYANNAFDFSLNKGDKLVVSIKCESGQILIDTMDIEGFLLVISDELYKEIEINEDKIISFNTKINEDTKGYIKLEVYRK